MRWLALGYNVPINPSKNRVYVWRKLKEFGAEYFKQGVAVLPLNKHNYAQLKLLSGKISAMGGEASIVELKFIESADEQEMVNKFKLQYSNEISQLKNDCLAVISEIKTNTGQVLDEYEAEKVKKIVRSYNKSKQRNHFNSNLVADIDNALHCLSDIVKQSNGDLSSQLIKFLDKHISF